jgi:hypothetical protein
MKRVEDMSVGAGCQRLAGVSCGACGGWRCGGVPRIYLRRRQGRGRGVLAGRVLLYGRGVVTRFLLMLQIKLFY